MTCSSDFPSESLFWIYVKKMIDSLDVLKSSRSVALKKFSNFEMLDAKIASALNKIMQNSHFKKEISFEEQKVQKEDRFLRGRHIVFMIDDYLRVTSAHNIVLDYADLFLSLFVNILFRSSIQDWTKFYCRWQKFHLMIFWKVCRSHRRRELLIRNFDCKIWTSDMRKSIQTQWPRVT